MPRRLLRARLGALLLALGGIACQPATGIDMTDPRVAAGAEKTCPELRLSAVRCTLLTLRAAQLLDDQRPGHGPVASRAIHEAERPADGQERLPDAIDVPGVVVFTLEDGHRIGVPLLCPRDADDSDEACNPRVE